MGTKKRIGKEETKHLGVRRRHNFFDATGKASWQRGFRQDLQKAQRDGSSSLFQGKQICTKVLP